MQDNNKDILVNKGWDAMQLILDKEMPQKKKRRFFLWWLFGGLLLISSYFIYSQINRVTTVVVTNKENITEEKPSGDKGLLAKLDLDVNKVNETSDKSLMNNEGLKRSKEIKLDEAFVSVRTREVEQQKLKTEEPKTIIPINSNSGFSPNSSELNYNGKLISESSSKTNNPLKNSLIENETKQDVDISEIVKLTEKEDEKTRKQEIAQQAIVDQKENLIDESFSKLIEEPVKDRLLLNLASLNLVEIKSLSFERYIVIATPSNTNPDYWYGQWGSNLNWAPGVNLLGFDVNLAIGRSFKDRIDLGLALSVGSFRYSESTNSESDINTTGRVLVSEAEAGNILNSSFRNASFIDLGIQSSLRLSNRFRFNAEVGYMYLFTSMFNSNNNPNDFSNTLDTVGGSEAMDVEFEGGEKIDFVFELEQKWFPYATIGTSFGLNKNLGLSFSYKKVFGELFEPSSNPLSMDQIQLGITYRFLDTSKKP